MKDYLRSPLPSTPHKTLKVSVITEINDPGEHREELEDPQPLCRCRNHISGFSRGGKGAGIGSTDSEH